jgi:hypothetical protein
MFTAGVVFAVLSGIQLFFIVSRFAGLYMGRKMLKFSDTPQMRHSMSEQRGELQSKMEQLEKASTKGAQVLALVFLGISILLFYFQ